MSENLKNIHFPSKYLDMVDGIRKNNASIHFPKYKYIMDDKIYWINDENLIPLDRWLRNNNRDDDDGILWVAIWKLLVDIRNLDKNSVILWSKKCVMIRERENEIDIVIYPTKKNITRFISTSTVEGKVISELLTSFKKQPNDIIELIFLYNRPIMMDLLHVGSSYHTSLSN